MPSGLAIAADFPTDIAGAAYGVAVEITKAIAESIKNFVTLGHGFILLLALCGLRIATLNKCRHGLY